MDTEEVAATSDENVDVKIQGTGYTELTHFRNDGTVARAWLVALCKTRSGSTISVPCAFNLAPGNLSEQPFILNERITEFRVEWVENGTLMKSKKSSAGQGKYFSYVGGWWVRDPGTKDLFTLTGRAVDL